MQVFNNVVVGGEPEYITIPNITDGSISQEYYNVITLSLTSDQATEMITNTNIKFTVNSFTFALQKIDYSNFNTFVFYGFMELDNIAVGPAMAVMSENTMKVITI